MPRVGMTMGLTSSVSLLSTMHAILRSNIKVWMARSSSASIHVKCCFRKQTRYNHIQRFIQYKASIITITSTKDIKQCRSVQ